MLGRSISHYLDLEPDTLPVDGGVEHLIDNFRQSISKIEINRPTKHVKLEKFK